MNGRNEASLVDVGTVLRGGGKGLWLGFEDIMIELEQSVNCATPDLVKLTMRRTLSAARGHLAMPHP